MIKNILFLIILAFLFIGCGEREIRKIEEQASFISMIMLFASISFLALSKNIQTWNFTKYLMQFFITKLSILVIVIIVFISIILFISTDLIGHFLSINLLISSAFLYKLRYDYENKENDIKTKETRYFTITLPTIIALTFLYSGGLQNLFK